MKFSLIYRSKIITDAYSGWITGSDRVLDVGCGNAVVTFELGRRFGCQITGTDLLDYRKAGIPFKIMAGPDKLPFSDKEFNVCVFNDALHHCRNHEGMIREALRVAERVLVFEMEPTLAAKLLDIFINQIHNSHMDIPLNMKTSSEWCAWLKKLNFNFELRKIRRKFFYPFSNFAFSIKASF